MAKTVLSVRIDEDELRKFEAAASFCRMSRSDVVQHLVRRFVQTFETEREELIADLRSQGLGYRRRAHDVS